MEETLIKVDGLSKKFCRSLNKSMWYGMKDIGSELLGRRHGADGVLRQDEFWAIKDINFELKRGECLGLIGHNGAGKSSLLKMLNGLIRPDQGRIEMRGRVGALIELGAGFNPILTGRENVYVNGTVLGFSKKEVDRKLADIIEFAEMEDFINMPVQSYSSGMRVRLGFAVAAQMEPDVLIIDEVLAVGDIGFVLKCLNWIDNTVGDTAVIFVSHSMSLVSRICSQIVLLDNGLIRYQGQDVGEGISQYLQSFSNGVTQVTYNRDNSAELLDAHVVGNDKKELPSIKRLDDLNIKFVFEVDANINSPVISLYFLDAQQRPIATCVNSAIDMNGHVSYHEKKKKFEVFLKLNRVQFSSGNYVVTFGLSEELDSKPLLRVRNALRFYVESDRHIEPPFEFEGAWSKSLVDIK